MKIIFLNLWGAKIKKNLAEFLKSQSHNTDIFCLQEVYGEAKSLLIDCLSDFKEVSATKPMAFGNNFFAQATYIKENIPIISSDTLLENENESGLGLSVYISFKGKDLHICNFHGLTFAEDDDKLDTSTRLFQSELIIKNFEKKSGLKIIGGDFNILPQAESIKMFEKKGYTDLIKKYHITTTRSRIALKKYPGHEEYFSDYVFISPDVKLKKFSVPSLEISDHLPLILEIDV